MISNTCLVGGFNCLLLSPSLLGTWVKSSLLGKRRPFGCATCGFAFWNALVTTWYLRQLIFFRGVRRASLQMCYLHHWKFAWLTWGILMLFGFFGSDVMGRTEGKERTGQDRKENRSFFGWRGVRQTSREPRAKSLETCAGHCGCPWCFSAKNCPLERKPSNKQSIHLLMARKPASIAVGSCIPAHDMSSFWWCAHGVP